MDDFFAGHVQRMRLATVDSLTSRDVAKFIQQHTYINGSNYSFLDHEYQERIVSDDSQEVNIRKCSQVGVSEVSLRMAMALCCLNSKYTVLYTFPTATFASNYMKTRFDPTIADSPYLRNAAKGSDVDNSEVKQFGNSYLYVRGCSSANQAIATPGDHLIHDEVDASDITTMAQYQSRLTHSPYKRKTRLSTPTLPGGPIDLAFQASKRWFNFVKCHHCGHQFIPDYYQHVRLEGSTVDVKQITKKNLHLYDYKSAYVVCPHCGGRPSLQIAHREWVCENPSENRLAAGYQVSPFDAPNIITPGYLIEASTQYTRTTDFVNVNLGLPAEDADSGMTAEDVDGATIELESSPFSTHVIGSDMGLVCRLFVAGVTTEGVLMIVHTEQVPISVFRTRYAELSRQYRVTSKVLDAQPYVETLLNLQQTDPNLFAAYFVNKNGLELYSTVSKEENEREGKMGLRQVSLNKNAILDVLLDDLRSGRILIRKTSDFDDVKAHMKAMKRVKQLTEDGIKYVWKKPGDGEDHFMMALLYTWVAAQIRGAAHYGSDLPPLVGSFKLLGAPSDRMKSRQGTGMR